MRNDLPIIGLVEKPLDSELDILVPRQVPLDLEPGPARLPALLTKRKGGVHVDSGHDTDYQSS